MRACGGRMMIPLSLITLSTAALDAGTLNALGAECTHHICQQVLRPQVQVQVFKPQVRVRVQVLRPEVQVQVLQICTRVQLEYKYKYQVLHVCFPVNHLIGTSKTEPKYNQVQLTTQKT